MHSLNACVLASAAGQRIGAPSCCGLLARWQRQRGLGGLAELALACLLEVAMLADTARHFKVQDAPGASRLQQLRVARSLRVAGFGWRLQLPTMSTTVEGSKDGRSKHIGAPGMPALPPFCKDYWSVVSPPARVNCISLEVWRPACLRARQKCYLHLQCSWGTGAAHNIASNCKGCSARYRLCGGARLSGPMHILRAGADTR